MKKKFLIFLFSFNTYFFGDPFTTYNDVSPIAEKLREGTRLSFFTFDQDRIEWIKFYLTGFIPDEILQKVQFLASDDHLWNLNLNWMGVISLGILDTGLVIAIKEKIKRVEIIILLLFAFSFPLLYSAAYLHDNNYFEAGPGFNTGARYMIPSFIMLSLVFGFIMQQIWDVYLRNNSSLKQNKSLAFKSIFVVIFITFFLFSFYDSNPVKSLNTSSFVIKNPNNDHFTNWIPTDLTDLPSDSIVFGSKMRRVIEGDVIFFNANYGIGDWKSQTDKNTPQKTIQILKEVMNSGYEVYTFKDNFKLEADYVRYLVENHGFVLKQNSNTFCKLELLNENDIKLNNFINVKSDQICIISTATETQIIFR